jgi:hypothetical protein
LTQIPIRKKSSKSITNANDKKIAVLRSCINFLALPPGKNFDEAPAPEATAENFKTKKSKQKG